MNASTTTRPRGLEPVDDTDLDAPPSTPRPLTPLDLRAIAAIKAMDARAQHGVDGYLFAQLLRAEGSATSLTIEEETAIFERVAARIERGDLKVKEVETGPGMTTEEALAAIAALQERFAPSDSPAPPVAA